MHRHIQPSRYDRREIHLALSHGQEFLQKYYTCDASQFMRAQKRVR